MSAMLKGRIMDTATLGVLGVMMTALMTVMIYLDRLRRADLKRIEERLDQRLDQLAAVVFDLVKTVGEIKGRLDFLVAAEVRSSSE